MKLPENIDYLAVSEVLSYCPETGVLTWEPRGIHRFKNAHRMRVWNSRYAGKEAGAMHTGYLRVSILGENILAHHLAWILFHGVWPSAQIDHKDMVRTNNRISNLRLASNGQNQMNSRVRKDSSSGVTGIHFRSKICKWTARISVDGARVNLGNFANFSDAVAARKAAEIIYHREFAAALRA